MTTFTGIVYYKDGKEVKKMSSEENKTIIKALNMFGRVPEMWELLEEIERLQKVVNDLSVSNDAYLFTGKDIDVRDKEIERLNENNQAMQEEMVRTWKKLDNKENIIKEVREYIEKYDFITGYYDYNYDDGNDTYTHYTVKEELLEILGGENNDK